MEKFVAPGTFHTATAPTSPQHQSSTPTDTDTVRWRASLARTLNRTNNKTATCGPPMQASDLIRTFGNVSELGFEAVLSVGALMCVCVWEEGSLAVGACQWVEAARLHSPIRIVGPVAVMVRPIVCLLLSWGRALCCAQLTTNKARHQATV